MARLKLEPPYHLFLGNARDHLEAKTAHGLWEWRPELCVGWSSLADCKTEIPGLARQSLAASRDAGARSLVLGVAPVGGKLPQDFVTVILEALDLGMNVIGGLHDRLALKPELAAAAARNGADLIDLRQPPSGIGLADPALRSGRRLLTVGTDLCIGKKFTALALEREMKRRGFNVDFRATGQTGILIAGGGIAVDAVPGDFISGAVQNLSPANGEDHWDVIEGQGCLLSPVTATSLGLINGAQAEALVLCHDPARTTMRGLGDVPMPDAQAVMDTVLMFARRVNPRARFIGLSINGSVLGEERAAREKAALADRFGLPVVDPTIDGVGALVDQI